MEITTEHLAVAHSMITDLEPDMQFVFSKIGRSDVSLYTERLVTFVHSKGKVAYSEAYRHVHSFFPSMRDFDDVIAGCVRAGYVKLLQSSGEMLMVAGTALPSAQNGTILRAESA